MFKIGDLIECNCGWYGCPRGKIIDITNNYYWVANEHNNSRAETIQRSHAVLINKIGRIKNTPHSEI